VIALAASSSFRERPTLLLVEDHDDTRTMYATFLRQTYDVLEAPDAPRALEILRHRVPALIVTDLALPGMDGFELISRVRADPESSTVPIICLSGFDGVAYAERAREVGVDRVLSKPCLPDALARAADEIMRTRRGGA
jgi:CheY-like chemotaxis protein